MTRPVIICHMISSVDGRIVTERWTPPVDGKNRDAIINQYFDIEKHYDADGWIIGRTTASEHFVKAAEPRKGSTDRFPRKAYVAHTSAKRRAIIMDPHGRLQYEQPDIEGDHIVAVLAETVADEYLQSLRDHGISYCFAGRDGHDIGKLWMFWEAASVDAKFFWKEADVSMVLSSRPVSSTSSAC